MSIIVSVIKAMSIIACLIVCIHEGKPECAFVFSLMCIGLIGISECIYKTLSNMNRGV